MVRQPRRSDGAKQDRILGPDLRHGVAWHHGACLAMAVAAPVVLGPVDATALPGWFQDVERGRPYFSAAAIARQNRRVGIAVITYDHANPVPLT